VFVWVHVPVQVGGVARQGGLGGDGGSAPVSSILPTQSPLLLLIKRTFPVGLFDRFKKQNHAPQAPAPAPASSLPTSHRSTAQPDFDALRAAASQNAPGAMDALWLATLSLEKWCFPNRREMKDGPRPFCGVVDGKPALFAFTDAARASSFAERNNLSDGGGPGHSILEVPTRGAMELALSLRAAGVNLMIFNDGAGGYFAPIDNLVPMYSHHFHVPLARAAAEFGLDPAPLLHDRLSQTGANEHFAELVVWAFGRPHWFLFADPKSPSTPLIWNDQTGAPTLAIFTSEDRFTTGARLMKLDAEGPAKTLKLPVAAAVAEISTLAAAAKLATVALNLRVPLRANAMADMLARMPTQT